MIRGVAFDIDDTLYPEADYVRSGFDAVALAVATSPEERAAVSLWLGEAFDAGIRGDTFDRLRERFPAIGARVTTERMVAAYRAHPPRITLGADVVALVERLSGAGVRLGIVTDGPAASQAAKVRALGLDRWFAPIVLTDTLGPGVAKPHSAAFEAVARAWELPAPALAYVADNPSKDFAGPRRLGWRTVRLRRPGQLHAHAEPRAGSDAPDHEVAQLSELWQALEIAG